MRADAAKKLLALGALAAFSLLVLFSDYSYSQAETPLTKAQALLSQGRYDEAVKALDGYIAGIQADPEQKPSLAAANYLLAKVYFEVGDDGKCNEALLNVFSAHPGFDREESNYGFREQVIKVKAALQAEAQGKLEEEKRAEALKQSEEQRRAEEQKNQEEQKRIEVTRKVEDLKKAEEAARTEADRILGEAQRLEKERKTFEEQLRPKDAGQSAQQQTTGPKPPLAENKTQENQKYSESTKRAMEAFAAKHQLAQQPPQEETKNQEKRKYSVSMMKAMEAFAEKQKLMEAEAARNKKAVSRLAEEPARLIIEMVPLPGKRYAIGKYAVTQGLWRAVMGNNPSGFPKGDSYPVETVSWNDVQEFIRKLNGQTGASYRLPTEAEWEYACRAGTTGERYGHIDIIAWYKDNSGGSTHPVGQKQPNNHGLYDTLGNVWEWCQDLYGSSGSGRVVRGGGWSSIAVLVRSDFRHFFEPGFRSNHLGFRLAMDK